MTASTTKTPRVRTPRLSVVVVSFNSPQLLARCLEALEPQLTADVEVLVVRDGRRTDVWHLRDRFARVRWIEAEGPVTVPAMRSLGMQQGGGEIVALLEDDCVVDSSWCRAVVAAHESEDAAIGGAVEPGDYRRALDWAVYFCEYGRFMLPFRPQPNIALALAGDNVTYKRAALEQTLPHLADGFIDMFVHSSWAEAQIPMRTEATLVVRNVNSWSLRHVTSVPYHHGRAFAGQRFAGRSRLWRAAMGSLVPGLPLLKVGRVVAGAIARKRHIGRFVQALPWIAVFMTSWSIGEAVGCLRGSGASALQWR